jgi:hypothetical protein
MSLSLLLPFGLFALAGVLLPLLIHLVRRTEQTAIDFAALRWLRESVKPRRRLRFEDPWLLGLRLLLLALVAFLLARPLLVGDWRGPRQWIAVADGVDIGAAKRELAGVEGEWRWLAPGFPEVGDAAPPSPQPFASLLREFDATLATSERLTVVVPAELDGLDAGSLHLQHAGEWRIVRGQPPASAVPVDASRTVALRHAAGSRAGLEYLRAALAAWQSTEPKAWSIDDRLVGARVDATTAWLIWLGAELPPELLAWVREGGRLLRVEEDAQAGRVVWRDASGAPLARDESIGRGHLIRLLQPATPERLPAVLDARFPDRLRALFEGARAAPTRALAAAVQAQRDSTAGIPTTTPLEAPLIILIALVFLAERLMATRRRSSA